jgi:hypothetical protein
LPKVKRLVLVQLAQLLPVPLAVLVQPPLRLAVFQLLPSSAVLS